MATLGTFTASISRVYHDNWDSGDPSFVCDERGQLVERPTVQDCPLLAPNREPAGDAIEVFDGYPASSAFGFSNDLLGDYVVCIGSEALFASAEFPELTSASPSSLALELTAEPTVPIADAFDGTAAVISAVRIRGDIGDSHIHAQPVVNFFEGRLFDITGHGEIPLAAMVDEIGFTLAILQLLDLARPCDIGHALASAQSPDIDFGILAKTENAVIVSDTSSRSEMPLDFFVQFIRIRDFSKNPHGQLGVQLKQSPGFMIKGFLQGKISEYFALPCFLTQPIGALITFAKSSQHGGTLFQRG